jgi:hypothetical protein
LESGVISVRKAMCVDPVEARSYMQSTLVFIIGPPAVGKMTVGLELSSLTGIPLFHNHQSIEAVLPVFDFGTEPFNRLVSNFRDEMFREVAESDLPGLIFTYVWAFDEGESLHFVQKMKEIFESRGGRTVFLELWADVETRLSRNRTELRLASKPSKRDVEESARRLVANGERYQLSSRGDFPFPDHLRIDNTHLTPRAVAEWAVAFFSLPSLPPGIDHLVFGAPHLEEGMDHIERLLGVRPVHGGRHPNWGTHNALVSLGPDTYLEVVAPDPELECPPRGRLFGLDALQEPRLVTWALRSEEMGAMLAAAEGAGVGMGSVESGGREKPDGTVLSWKLTDPYALPLGGAVPFLIGWGATPHPASAAPRAGTLTGLRMGHPDPGPVRKSLLALGTKVDVTQSDDFYLCATIRTPSGSLDLY